MKTTRAEHVLFMFCGCGFHGNSMNNLLSYCGLIDAKIIASDKDLPVIQKKQIINMYLASFPLRGKVDLVFRFSLLNATPIVGHVLGSFSGQIFQN